MPVKPAIAAAISAPLLAVAAVAAIAGAIITAPVSTTTSICTAGFNGGSPNTGNLSAARLGNAQIIAEVGISMGVPAPGEAIAIATALQESGLQNLNYGDRDSLGLFQQRPSQGWGSPAQILTPAYAARQFYSRLLQVPGWRSMSTTDAAQAVQHSGFPYAYAKWQDEAQALAAAFTGGANCTPQDSSGLAVAAATAKAAGYHIPAGVPAPIVTAISFALAQIGKPYIWGGTGPDGWDCSGLMMMAYRAAGIAIPRGSIAQSTVGIPVYDTNSLQPGDLLFVAGSDGTVTAPGHVGMYLGQGILVEAPHTGLHVQLSPLAGYWRENLVAIRRQLN
ncbi:C40 family peptidase [Catenulispora sp. NL8]|uniref:C40 family peptidase n=1 Tax=Catenulispora pinistramenti TaxID=2705254 RepID=A0ABS5KLI8_9ACTN|nr:MULTISPECIES: C40 family peptidase [Catenulispora]MBS2546904.1 C40 family peptidase [Catenulispora pinistramenti]